MHAWALLEANGKSGAFLDTPGRKMFATLAQLVAADSKANAAVEVGCKIARWLEARSYNEAICDLHDASRKRVPGPRRPRRDDMKK